MIRRIAAATVLVVLAALLSACSPPAPSTIAKDDAAAHRQFGAPAVPAPSGFTYQPDVVVVGGGRNAVLGGSADGLTWRFASDAPGIGDVRVGRVLWATAMVVGRVVGLTRGPVETEAVLAPVALTEVIRDGTISFDTSLDPGDVDFRRTDIPVVTTTDEERPDVSTVVSRASPGPKPAFPPWVPGRTGGVSGEFQGYEVGVNYAPDGLNLSVARNTAAFKIQVDFGVRYKRFRVQSSTRITDGVAGSTQTVLKGLQELTVGVTGGAASPTADNSRVRIELPYTVQAQVSEVPPLVVQVRFSAFVATAFTGKNSTLAASARWKLMGDLGTAGGQERTPEFGVQQSLTNSIRGISLGPSGVVIGFSMRVLGGLGLPGFAAGPYVKLAAVVGVTNGSALGASLVRCRGATLDLNWATGAAVGINSEVLDSIVAKIGGKFSERIKASAEASIERSRSIISRTEVVPDVPLCRTG